MLPLLLSAPVAHALDSDTFDVSGSAFDGRTGLQVLDPTVGHPGAAYGGLAVVYAHAPLVRLREEGLEEPVVRDLFATRIVGGYSLLGKLRLEADVPFYPYVGGPDASQNGVSFGDVKVSATIPAWHDDTFAIGVAPAFVLPTGRPRAWTGSGGIGAGLTAAAGFRPVEILTVDANLGVLTSPAGTLGGTSFGTGLTLGLGGTVRATDTISVGAELDGFVTVVAGEGGYTRNPVELHAFGSWGRGEGPVAMLGLGTGLVAGMGAPDVRVIGSFGWTLPGREPVYDRDGDGLLDPDDACPDEPEDADGFEDADGCPEIDNDGDGLVDASDRCPLEPEDTDRFEDEDGCPDPDNDGDGLADADDSCPLEAGTIPTRGCPDRDGDTLVDTVDACPDDAGPLHTNGCPDRDGDRVPDARDKCPDEPCDPREDPARSDGCPRKRVIVTKDRIEISEKIFFDTGKSTIKKQSYSLLSEIAVAMNDNPDITAFEIAGHTDSVGSDASNQKLSQGRADAVVKHLSTVGGVAVGRLAAVGYGESTPVDTNSTEPGRASNRRVEFVIKGVSAPASPDPLPTQADPWAPAPAAKPTAPDASPWSPAPTPSEPDPWKAPPPAPAPKPANPDDPFGLDEF